MAILRDFQLYRDGGWNHSLQIFLVDYALQYSKMTRQKKKKKVTF